MLSSRTPLLSVPLLSSSPDTLNQLAAAQHIPPLGIHSRLTIHDIAESSNRNNELVPFITRGEILHVLPTPRRDSAAINNTALQQLQHVQSLREQCLIDGIDAQLRTTSMRIAENARILDALMHRREACESSVQAVFKARANEHRVPSHNKTLADPFLFETLRREQSFLLSVARPHLVCELPSRGVTGTFSEAMVKNIWDNTRQRSVLATSGLVSALDRPVSLPLDALSINVSPRHPMEELRAVACTSSGHNNMAAPSAMSLSRESPALKTSSLNNALGIDQDVNWLSECQVLVRLAPIAVLLGHQIMPTDITLFLHHYILGCSSVPNSSR